MEIKTSTDKITPLPEDDVVLCVSIFVLVFPFPVPKLNHLKSSVLQKNGRRHLLLLLLLRVCSPFISSVHSICGEKASHFHGSSARLFEDSTFHTETNVSSMMARSKSTARKSVLPPTKVKVKKGAIVNEGSSTQKERRKASHFAVYVKAFTRGLKKAFKEDNILKQTEVMVAMSEWWNAGYLRKNYDPNYAGSSSDEENDEDDVNDDESSEEEGDNCPPRPNKKKKTKGERKNKKKLPIIVKTRCSPRKFVSLIDTLSEDQRDAIKALNPFHTLLNVKCGHMHRAFAMRLVQCFNPDSCSIEFRRGTVVHITEDDVARVLGMPIGDTPVPTECVEAHRQKIEADFKGGFKGIEILQLENVLKEGHTDRRFHRAYMLFTLACLLCPTTKEVAGSRLFPGVVDDDLETIKTYKWPAFVLDWLVNEIRNYKVRGAKRRGKKQEGVGGSLFLLLVIYFDLNPLDVEVGNEPEAPIGLWTKELIDLRISKEEEDKASEDYDFSQFPPHNLKNQICIDKYKDFMRQFMSNSKFLHEMDAAMGEPGVRSPIVGIRVEDEGHSPQFCGNFEPQNDEQWEGEDEDQIQQKGEEEDDGDQIKETGDDIEQEVEVGGTSKSIYGSGSGMRKQEEVVKDSLEGEEVEVAKDSLDEEEDGDHIKETGDDSEQEGEVGGTSTFIHGSGSSKRKQEEVVILTDPIKTKRRRNVKPSPSIKSPYVAVPFVKTTKITTEEETIIKYLMNGPTNDLSEVLIRIKGAKWPLTRKEVAESFRVRGHVSNMSNLLASESDEFNTVLRDDCDPDKVGYELLKCDMLFLPVLESQHWFCVCISPVASRAFILDSMKPTAENKKHRLEQANIIQKNLLALLKKRPARHIFKVDYADVPQQSNMLVITSMLCLGLLVILLGLTLSRFSYFLILLGLLVTYFNFVFVAMIVEFM
ncbi:hypothetical protein RHMOL_Rhmol06G0232000 [Rhododendron molle]|uniref:Uncharacterized protein n=1 Tax=Rhododendron molle TaxID=49168 RepID=A0ACC0NFP1_RHOML|nr:hypothetical protein RHMOL_Rhmol06G0232000 [Rhododendron molle]